MKTRKDFLSEIDVILNNHQFEKNENIYTCIQQQEQPGATININGQIIQQPPQLIVNKFILTCLGEGWVSDVDESNKLFFEQVRYEIFQNDNQVFNIEDCFYYDEAERIMNNFMQQ